jgi:oxygen-independent coproporphyrinogen-3 oxidase
MLVYCDFKPEQLYTTLHELIRLAFPGCRIILGSSPQEEAPVQVKISKEKNKLFIRGAIKDKNRETVKSEKHLLLDQGEVLNHESKWLLRSFTYRLLCQHTGSNINPYGLLTGVRPVKLVHRLLDEGFAPAKIEHILQTDYFLNQDKAALLLEVALNNRPFLLSREQVGKLLSVYIGIPFCPSRCYYCSFPAAVLSNYQQQVNPFLEALHYEITRIGEFLQEQDIAVQSIYIGGGTPTVLSERDLESLLDLLQERFISPLTQEITVEAGRPDTLSPLKLKLMQEAGVNRICVNPQSMNDSTLQRIGRNHDQKGVLRSVEWVRSAGIKKLNMDLIVGLPGESIPEYLYTAEKILQLDPDNITVHTLARKRGSLMAEAEATGDIKNRVSQVQEGVELFSTRLRAAGYNPYYMYRQKYMSAAMENIGYARPADECIYNIQMMEERQTIIGLGGGAASKFIRPDDWRLSSSYQPKDPSAYAGSVEELVKRKVDKLWALN